MAPARCSKPRLDLFRVVVLAVVVGLAGAHGPAAPIIGAAICFVIRLAGLTLGLNIPRARRSNRD